MSGRHEAFRAMRETIDRQTAEARVGVEHAEAEMRWCLYILVAVLSIAAASGAALILVL